MPEAGSAAGPAVAHHPARGHPREPAAKPDGEPASVGEPEPPPAPKPLPPAARGQTEAIDDSHVVFEHGLVDELQLNCEAMARHAMAKGLTVPAVVIAITERHRLGDGSVDLQKLCRAHERLLRLVAPATPGTLRLLEQRPTGWLGMLGPVRLIRHMVVVVLVLLVAFIALASTPWVNTASGNILTSHGWDAIVNELFFVTAGGMGAAFAALFLAYTYVAEGTYDPKFESSYWIRIILGLVAGILLPALVPLGSGTGSDSLTRPALAIVGGFSATLVYTILQRLVDVVGSLFQGVAPAQPLAAVDPLGLSSSGDRLTLVSELTKLGSQLQSGTVSADAMSTVQGLLRTLMPEKLADSDDLTSLQSTAQLLPPPPGAGDAATT